VLLERERELDALSRALAGTREGTGAVVVIEGAAGIGKSRLVDAACQRAGAEQIESLHGRGVELERDVPFGVARGVFGERLANASAAQRRQWLAGHAALVARLFDPSGSAGATDPHALIHGLYWLTLNLGGVSVRGLRQPLVIAVDDAQWSDRPSASFLAYLAARIVELPIALVVAVRTGEEAAAPQQLAAVREAPNVVRLAPSPLSDAGVGRLLGAELPEPAPEFVATAARVTGGNPFLVRELAESLRAEGVGATAHDATRIENLVPATVLHSLLTRLARLGDDARRVAEALAVLGGGAPLRHAVSLADMDRLDAERAADALARAGLLAAGEPLRFQHPLIGAAVAADLPAFAKARAHRVATAILDADGAPAEEIAAHLLLTAPAADEWVCRVLREAAHGALTQGDPVAAASLLQRAVKEPPPGPQRADVLLELAEAGAMSGAADAERHARQALELLDGAPGRRSALRLLGRIHLASGDHAAAAAVLRELLDELGSDSAEGQELLGAYLTVNRFRAPLHPEAERRLAPIVAGTRDGRVPSNGALVANVALTMALAGEKPATVRRLAAVATRGDPLVDARSLGLPMGMLVQALCAIDELEEAERLADRGLAAARRSGSLLAAGLASYHLAIPRYHRGALADALADLDQALAPSREGRSAAAGWPLALLAAVQLELGDLDGAHSAIAAATPPAGSMDEAVVALARARVNLACRRPEAALADALHAGRHFNEGFGIDHPGLAPWRVPAALAALALDRSRQARELAQEGLERARWCGVPRAISAALRTVAMVGGPEQRVTLLEEAVAMLDDSPSALERAHALGALGGSLRRAGRRTDAQPPLREALQLADRMGATQLAQAAREELIATGARPRRAAFTGVEALTPAERRVAQLAAGGMTNAQIAQDLFVSPKTVQTHLAHAFRKLDVTSRRQLRDVLGASRSR
jgi:DNA-binding CsgD family transcriptional regulator